ncbi:MAG TPA: AAA family ATPase [Gemmataceae bacterium]|nr:AAA family ATPase [Gemmataceae bacterium]
MPDTGDALTRMLNAGQLEPYLRYIRFPHFRNLRDNLRIDFSYPVTALVGPNGTNKTAVLRAIQGCPDYYNVGQYWFSTSLDPISEPIKPEERHRFIHGYIAQSTGEMVEVIKTRIARRADPDYFEPSRPLVQDGMTRLPGLPAGTKETPDRVGTRWKAINKEVIYLDFRSQLSAFDKYFYQIPYNANIKTVADKKAFLRRKAIHLVNSINTSRTRHRHYNRERIVEPATELAQEQVVAISKILGRTYESISILQHRYFGFDGYSVRLRASNYNYSEAFAGSGEFAVVMLVYEIAKASEASLILLDEPEVSLHPGGQRALLAFLREQAKLRRHQFVISTHSPEMIRELPSEAIKLFQEDPSDGKIDLISQQTDPLDAFFRLGVPTEISRSVFVEDGLAAAIVRTAIRPLGEAAYRQVSITAVPGGASQIYSLIPAFAALDQQCLIILDGDQRQTIPEVASVADADLESTVRLLLGGAEPKLLLHGGNDPDLPSSRLRELRRVISWMAGHVSYLPGGNPETMLLRLEGDQAAYTSTGAKHKWEERARASMGRQPYESVESSDILGEQQRALATIRQESPEFQGIRSSVQVLLQSAGAS